MQNKRLVVGISGASGALLGIEILRAMRQFANWETHLVLSTGARRTILAETNYTIAEVESLASVVHAEANIGASIASGSFQTEGMIIAPCSMKTLAGVANGFSENLLLRSADVVLKERRRLVLAPRETPLNLVHLRNMVLATEAGAILLPPMITCYQRPASVEEMMGQIAGRMIGLFGLEVAGLKRWGEQVLE